MNSHSRCGCYFSGVNYFPPLGNDNSVLAKLIAKTRELGDTAKKKSGQEMYAVRKSDRFFSPPFTKVQLISMREIKRMVPL